MEKFSKGVSTNLEEKRRGMFSFVRDKVLEIKKATENKERELILKVDTFFDLAMGKINEILGPNSFLGKDMKEKIENLSNKR